MINDITEKFIQHLLKRSYPHIFDKIEQYKKNPDTAQKIEKDFEKSFVSKSGGLKSTMCHKSDINKTNPDICLYFYKDIECLKLDPNTLTSSYFSVQLESTSDFDLDVNKIMEDEREFLSVTITSKNIPKEKLQLCFEENGICYIGDHFLESDYKDCYPFLETAKKLQDHNDQELCKTLIEKILFDKPISQEIKEVYMLNSDIDLSVFDRLGATIISNEIKTTKKQILKI